MKQREKPFIGVNLGGWLVLEKWLTPEVFAGTEARDEYTFMQTPSAKEKRRRHNREFIREADFAWLAEHGVTHIRLPVGYWVLDGDDPYIAARGRLDWAFLMAKKYHLNILLCLHGAPGSQNGRDHSGKIGNARWYDDATYRQKTLDSLVALAQRYGQNPQLWGIELLNEPKMKVFQRMLRAFYRQSYAALDPLLHPDAKVVFSDAFSPRRLSGALRGRSRAAMDVHWYHFGAVTHLPLRWYFWLVKNRAGLLSQLQWQQPTIVGEWSGIMKGPRLNNISAKKRQVLIDRYIARQQMAYQHALGWFYWTYRADHLGTWDFRAMVESGRLKLPK